MIHQDKVKTIQETLFTWSARQEKKYTKKSLKNTNKINTKIEGDGPALNI